MEKQTDFQRAIAHLKKMTRTDVVCMKKIGGEMLGKYSAFDVIYGIEPLNIYYRDTKTGDVSLSFISYDSFEAMLNDGWDVD